MKRSELRTANLNDDCQIKMTPLGREIYRKHMLERGGAISVKLDVDGWLSLPLWQVMQIFGPHIWHGCDVPFETEIRLTASDLAAVKEA